MPLLEILQWLPITCGQKRPFALRPLVSSAASSTGIPPLALFYRRTERHTVCVVYKVLSYPLCLCTCRSFCLEHPSLLLLFA